MYAMVKDNIFLTFLLSRQILILPTKFCKFLLTEKYNIFSPFVITPSKIESLSFPYSFFHACYQSYCIPLSIFRSSFQRITTSSAQACNSHSVSVFFFFVTTFTLECLSVPSINSFPPNPTWTLLFHRTFSFQIKN